MTGLSIGLILAVCVFSVAPQFIPRSTSEHAGHVIDAITSVLMIGAAAASALCATAGGPAHGVGVVVAVSASAVAAMMGGGYVVRLVLRAGGVTATADEPDAAPLRGGRVIGYLERAAVAGTLLSGWPEGLAVILAVKSLARFPELRAPHASEQFIMGTFASVLWSSAMSGIGYLILH